MSLPPIHDGRRACSNCTRSITRMSRTGLCPECYHSSGVTAEAAAEAASRRYYEAIEAYRDKYERRAG